MKTKITHLLDAALAFVSKWIIVFTVILITLLLALEVTAQPTVGVHDMELLKSEGLIQVEMQVERQV